MSIWDEWKRKGISIGVTGLAFLMNACVTLPGIQAESGYYYLGFLNKTGNELNDVEAYFGKTLVASRLQLLRGQQPTEGPETLPIPKEAEVRWERDGRRHVVRAKLEGVVPKGLDGTIYFVFNADGTVDVKPVGWDDRDAYHELVKGMRPEGQYRFGFVNKTGRDLPALSVFYGNQEAGGGGYVLERTRVNYSDTLTLPIPSEAEVRWTENGTSHAVKVKLEGVPKGFEGILYFVFTSDGAIEATPVKRGDDEGARRLFDEASFPKSESDRDTIVIPRP
ncbi:hypothetical protein JW916_11915 [Candidatus Sumerlaeota bacterium]|nr:hypothetical protein [Candidatus Sumerlaeota bacterium]